MDTARHLLDEGALVAGVDVLQGEQDQVCDAARTREFVGHVPRAGVLSLPKVGHACSVGRNCLPQLTDYARVAGAVLEGLAPRAAPAVTESAARL